jgi:penicillin amidase
MREVLSAASDVTVEDIKTLQRDTYMISSARLRDALVARAHTIRDLTPPAVTALEIIASWNGRHDIDSKGAVAFEAAIATLVPSLGGDIERTIIEIGGSEGNTYAELIENAAPGSLDAPLKAALSAAGRALSTYANWRDMHTLALRHTFGALPLVGGRYRYGELPWPGSSDTLWRADHGLSTAKVTTGFGSQARYISDMSDLDSNWFALLGGNDGWLNSANFLDEVEAFRTSALIQMPLRLETLQQNFPYRTALAP